MSFWWWLVICVGLFWVAGFGGWPASALCTPGMDLFVCVCTRQEQAPLLGATAQKPSLAWVGILATKKSE